MIDLESQLDCIDEFKTLSTEDKKICVAHLSNPTLDRIELAKKLKKTQNEMYQFFHSKEWEKINLELARRQLSELIQLSVKTLRDCLTIAKPDVKLKAAIQVLTNAQLLQTQPKTIKDSKLMIVWKDNAGISNEPIKSICTNSQEAEESNIR